ncbi:transglycosylase SLT domain-containing protein [Lentzea kentuckyensis]|uniref:transglycosylase SLT domain-containing protein n=1 Tax=Lentzea kentuckyensis TaxID=360086 RepID=UPI000A3CDA01|nr:transglycosylase SLT domain-containing protein [Lentzea kentuckyensis]
MPTRGGSTVWLDVLPSLRGFGAMFAKEAAGAGSKAGKQLGNAIEEAVGKASKRAADVLAENVEDASDRVKEAADGISKANDKVADAAGRVTVAEAKLADARKKHGETDVRTITAQERLATATRAKERADRDAAQATENHTRATAELTEAQTRLNEETNKSDGLLKRLSGRLSKVDTDRIDRGAKSMAKFSAAAYASAAGIAAIGGALPAVAGVSAIMAQASGAALVLPGALAAGGVAAGTLKLGLSGVGDALKEWNDVDKFNEKIKELSGNARAFAVEVRDLRPELIGLRNATQDRLFAGAAEDVKTLSDTYIPLLSNELGNISSEFSLARQSLVGFAVEGGTVRDVTSLLNLTEQQVHNVRSALAPLAAAFLDVSVVGGEAIARLTSGLGDNAAEFAAFVAHARETGQIEQWIYGGLQALDDLGQLLRNVSAIIGTVFGAANAQGGSLLDTMNAVTGSVVAMLQSTQGTDALATFFRTVHDTVQNLLPGLRAVSLALLEGIVLVGPQIPPVAQAFSDVAISIAPLIPDLASLAVSILPPIVALVRELAPAVGTLAAAWIGGHVALLAFNGAVAIFKGFQWIVGFIRAWAAGQLALNVAMTANPIGIIVAAIGALVAAVIYLWNNNEGFRNFFINAWSSIRAAVVVAWEQYIKPAFAAVVGAVKAVGEGAVWLWRNAFVPAWSAISGAVSTAWGVLSTIFDAVVTVFKYVGTAIFTLLVVPYVLAFQAVRAAVLWAWENGIKPTLEALGNFFSWLWVAKIQPFVNLLKAAFGLLVAAAIWLWQNGLKPPFDAIGIAVSWLVDQVVAQFNLWIAAVQALWHGVNAALSAIGGFFTWLWAEKISPFIEIVKAGLSLVGHAFQVMWSELVRPALQSLGDFLTSLYDNVVGRVFALLKEGASSVGGAFDSVVGWIERVWGRLREILAKPVNFVIQSVYNDGLRAVWNKVAEFVGISGLPQMNPITFAGGGVISGYAPGRDIVPALLSPGEAVLVPEAVRLLGAQNILALNAATSGRRGNVVGGGYSGGGVVNRFAGGGVIGTIASWVGEIGQSVVDLFSDPAAFVRSRLGGGGGWVEQLALLPGKVLGKAADFLWDKIKGWFGGDTPTGGDQLAQWITAGMRIAGVPGTWFDPLHTLIMRESGGNPNAINLWDSNAQAGYPSQGLMQTIPQTFAAYRDPRLPNVITDPVANIVAGIRYILARYGSVFNVQQAVGSTPMGYDSGGYLMPGVTTVYNGTGRPEPVLTAAQWNALQGNTFGSDEPMIITGRLDLGDGLEARIDGRISQAQQQVGAAIAARRRF